MQHTCGAVQVVVGPHAMLPVPPLLVPEPPLLLAVPPAVPPVLLPRPPLLAPLAPLALVDAPLLVDADPPPSAPDELSVVLLPPQAAPIATAVEATRNP